MKPPPAHVVAFLLALAAPAAGQPAADPIARLKACSELEPAARIACIDPLLKDLSKSSPAPAQQSQSQWIVSETTSPVDYKPQITAVLTPEAGSEDGPSSLSIRCRAGRTELMLSTNGSWPAIRTDELRVGYRIDNAPAVWQRWVASPTGGTAYFRDDVVAFLKSLPPAARLSVQVTHGRGTSRDAVFNLQGLQEVRQKLAAACRWAAARADAPQ
jgi:Type VI secretion system VasI, EvfG, VC_A0118